MFKTILAVAALAAVGTAQAQTSWSTGFSSPAQGSFATIAVGNGATVATNPATLNDELWLQGTGAFGNLGFALSGSSVPAFTLQFSGARTVSDVTTVRVVLSGPSSTTTGVQFVDVPLRATLDLGLTSRTLTLVPNSSALWAPGNYLLQFVPGRSSRLRPPSASTT